MADDKFSIEEMTIAAKDVTKAVQAAGADTMKVVSQVDKSAGVALKATLSAVFTVIGQIISAVVSAASSVIKIATGIASSIINVIHSGFKIAVSIISSISNFIFSVFKSIANIAMGAIQSIGNIASAIFSSIGGLVLNLSKSILHLATNVLGQLAEAFVKLSSTVITFSLTFTVLREKQMTAMTALIGSVKEAQKEFKILFKMALAPGLNVEQSISAFNQLKSVIPDVQLIHSLIREIANAVALSGGGANEFKLAIRGVAQMFGKGKISAEELNQQILEQAPLIRNAMKAAFPGMNDARDFEGKPTPFEKILGISKSKTSVTDFWKKILGEMEKMPRMTDTIANSIENIWTALKEVGIAFGQALLGPKFFTKINNISSKIYELRGVIISLGNQIRITAIQLAKAFGLNTANVFKFISDKIKQINLVMQYIGKNSKNIANWMKNAWAKSMEYGKIAIDFIVNMFYRLKPIVFKIKDWVVIAFENVKSVVETYLPVIIEKFNVLKAKAMNFFSLSGEDKVATILAFLQGVMNKAVELGTTGLVFLLNKFNGLLQSWLGTSFSSMLPDSINKMWSTIKPIIERIIDSIIEIFNQKFIPYLNNVLIPRFIVLFNYVVQIMLGIIKQIDWVPILKPIAEMLVKLIWEAIKAGGASFGFNRDAPKDVLETLDKISWKETFKGMLPGYKPPAERMKHEVSLSPQTQQALGQRYAMIMDKHMNNAMTEIYSSGPTASAFV